MSSETTKKSHMPISMCTFFEKIVRFGYVVHNILQRLYAKFEPFLTKTGLLRGREINQVIDMGNEGKMLKSTMFIKSMQDMLLTIGSILCLIYWVIGLYHYYSACPI